MQQNDVQRRLAMKKFPKLILALSLCWAVDPALANSEWRVDKDKNGIRIESRAVDGWDIREIRGSTEYTGPISSLINVINDASAAPRLNEIVSESRVTERTADGNQHVYMVLDMPWPLQDRDVLMLRETKRDPQTGIVTIVDKATQDVMQPKEGLVRMVRSSNQWQLSPKPGGSILVELRMLSDPAGKIPASLINSMSVDAPFKTLSQLKEIATEPKYADTSATTPQDAR
jgi:hypothetical protein